MSHHSIAYRSVGILLTDEGVILRADPLPEGRTEIMASTGLIVGAIVRNSESGRWSYDAQLRAFLGIDGDPDFGTDAEAGRKMGGVIPSLAQVKEKIRRLIVIRNEDDAAADG